MAVWDCGEGIGGRGEVDLSLEGKVEEFSDGS